MLPLKAVFVLALGGNAVSLAKFDLGAGASMLTGSLLGGAPSVPSQTGPNAAGSGMLGASELANQVQQTPALNLTMEQVAAMESAAAVASRTNQALKTELTELASKLDPLKEEVEAIRAAGGLDEAQNRLKKEFLAHIPTSATLATLAALGAGKTATAALEAPIVFLQPAVLPAVEQLQQLSTTTCKRALYKSHAEAQQVLKSEFGDLSFDELDSALKEVSDEYDARLKQREKESKQLTDLEQLIATGDASAQVQLRRLARKMQKEEKDMQKLRLRLTALHMRKKGGLPSGGSDGESAGY